MTESFATSSIKSAHERQLHDSRNLTVTADYRSVLGEIMAKHLGAPSLSAVFPRFNNDPRQFLGVVKS